MTAVPASGFWGRVDVRALARLAGADDGRAGSSPANGPLEGGAWGDDAVALHRHGALALAWHGELYDEAGLRRDLGLGHAEPLAGVLAAGWRRWGAGLLSRLDGMFALALVDGATLWLACDPSGLRHLYVFVGTGGSVTFATHLDTLLRLPGVVRRLARRSLHEYLRFLDIAAPNTLYEGVRAVEAGRLLRFSATGMESVPWPHDNLLPAAPRTFAEAVDMLDDLLQRSVQRRLAGAARPAAFLSGGVDSALLCAIAARQRPETVAVTVGFDGARYDETPVARRIAAHLGIDHEVLRFDRGQYQQAFEALSGGLEQPMADPATPATVLAFAHCRERYDAVLDGMGADEAVGAMPPRHVRLATGWASLLPRGVRKALVRGMRALPRVSGYTPIVDFDHPAETTIRWSGFTRPEIEVLCGEPVSFADTTFYRTYGRFARRAHLERYSALLDAMPCERLNQAWLLTPAPVRFPFWDSEANRLLRTLAHDFRHRPNEPKRILRSILSRYLPRELWDMPKHSFDFPLREFLVADDCALVRHWLDRARWARGGLLAPDAVQRLALGFVAGDSALTFRVWALVLLGAWLERHDKLY